MASRSPQPAGGHDPARRGSGVRPAGPRTPGSEAAAEPGEGGRAWAEPPAAQAQWGHVALPVPAGGRGRVFCPGGAAPEPPDCPVSRPGGPCRLACHVTESRRPPEVACVTATEIPDVESVSFLADPGAEGGGDSQSRSGGVGQTRLLSRESLRITGGDRCHRLLSRPSHR